MIKLLYALAYFSELSWCMCSTMGLSMPYFLHTFKGSSTIRHTWCLYMMESMEHISLTLCEDLQSLHLHPPPLLWVPLLQPLLLLLPVHLLLLLWEGMHLQLLLSHLMQLLVGARNRTSLSQASRLSSPCAAPTTLSSVSLINRWANGFLLLRSTSVRCTLLWVLRPPRQSSTHIFLLQPCKTCELGTSTPSEMKMTTSMRSMKTPSEDFFPSSLFGAWCQRGRRRSISLFSYSPIFSDCNIRLSTWVV
jgi:hypothetical protein